VGAGVKLATVANFIGTGGVASGAGIPIASFVSGGFEVGGVFGSFI
jgi:hypothetical protein